MQLKEFSPKKKKSIFDPSLIEIFDYFFEHNEMFAFYFVCDVLS